MKNIIVLIAFLFFGCSNPQGGDDTVGAEGPPGPQGEQGPIGPQGPKGDKGDQGIQGPAGNMGPQGPMGVAGSTGPAGPQGSIGATGAQGPQGATGAQGPQGPQGAQGAQGNQGPQGVAGPQGPAGPSGFSVRVLDNNGNELGFPIPWRGSNGIAEMAILMHRDNASGTFPEGWVIPETSPGTIYYSGANCTGLVLFKMPVGYGPVLYNNFLFWVAGHNVLYKKTGSVNIFAVSSRANGGACTANGLPQQTLYTLEDSGFRLQIENTTPWTAVAQ